MEAGRKGGTYFHKKKQAVGAKNGWWSEGGTYFRKEKQAVGAKNGWGEGVSC